MKFQKIIKCTRQKGIKEELLKNLKKNGLVRAIQPGEGNYACFNADYVDIFKQSGSICREDCLRKTTDCGYRIKEVESMLVRVIFTNQSVGIVKATSLEHLIRSGKVSAYYINQWIPVSTQGHDKAL